MQCDHLFPTLIFTRDFPTLLLKPLIDYIYLMEEMGHRVSVSNMGGFQSPDNFINSPICAALHREISSLLADIAKHLHVKEPIKISNGWANINRKGDFNSHHCHSKSYLSGVFYLQADEQASPIVFNSPLIAKVMYEPIYDPVRFEVSGAVAYLPVVGRCIVFPSWLEHSVPVSRSDRDRISISFNTYLP
jgi:uncharacterized protein (TIGR02466 family)